MAEKVLMLALSPTMEEGTIVTWNKKEGDTISTGEVLCEVETDKATMDYESIQEGTLLKILVKAGEGAKVEQPIAIIGKKGENIDSLLKEVAIGPAKTAAPAQASANGTGGVETASPRLGASAAAPAAGEVQAPVAGAAKAPFAGGAPAGSDGRVKSSPLARALAKQSGVDITALSGSGPGGRIVRRDVEQAAAGGGAPSASPAMFVQSAGTLQTQEIPVAGKRKVIAERLSQSMYTSPHYYVKISVPADNLIRADQRSSASGRSEPS